MSDLHQRSLDKRVIYGAFRILAQWICVHLLGLRYLGRNHFPRTGGGLILSTHQSNFDPVLVGLGCSRRLNYLARKTLFRNRMLAPLIRFLDAIEIDREGGGLDGIRETIARLKRGELVLIFPEGTRTNDGSVGPIKSGFLSIARRSKVPLIPVAVVGAFDVLPRGTKWPSSHPVAVIVGPPIEPVDFLVMDDATLLKTIAERLQSCDQRGRAILSVRCRPFAE